MFAASKTAGAAAAAAVNYIEDVFGNYLYTGNGSTQTITNGIDLSTKGGLVWTKKRSAVDNHLLVDTVRGASNVLQTDLTDAQFNGGSAFFPSFTSTGYTTGTYPSENGATYASWTFRKQPKFFDVVTYTGNGSGTRAISHLLGSVPGCIILKRTDSTSNWQVYHQNLTTPNASAASNALLLNDTVAGQNSSAWGSTAPTSTQFTVGSSQNTNGATFVAYLFAHNAGGFGLTGTDNVISCGSFSVDGSGNATVDLGYEPQWVLIKTTEADGAWAMFDNMRGMPVGNTNIARLFANTSGAESSSIDYNVSPTATGFTAKATGYAGSSTDGFIYIAIRRGPMKVPTDATKVFSPITTAGSTGTVLSTGFRSDMTWGKGRTFADGTYINDRLRGYSLGSTTPSPQLNTTSTAAEDTASYPVVYNAWNTSALTGAYFGGYSTIFYNFQRAPSFFDEVCWTGTGSGSQAITHNLNAVPEFTITKRRSGTGNWSCFPVMFGVNTGIYLDSTAALQTNAALHPTLPTSTTYYTNDASWGDENIGGTFVTYLFATCAGVSKVGSYTGNGTTQTINCGFTGGARFVLIKRTDSTGGWYVYDTARGMTTLTDPYLLLNSTAAETATLGSVTTVSTGFAVNASILAAINTNGASYIFLAIA